MWKIVRMVIAIIVLSVAYVIIDAFLVRAEAFESRESAAPPAPLRTIRITATFCGSIDQIMEIIRLVNNGFDRREARDRVNLIEGDAATCETRTSYVWQPKLLEHFETHMYEVTVYEVQTPVGVKYMTLYRRLFKA